MAGKDNKDHTIDTGTQKPDPQTISINSQQPFIPWSSQQPAPPRPTTGNKPKPKP